MTNIFQRPAIETLTGKSNTIPSYLRIFTKVFILSMQDKSKAKQRK